MNYEEYTNNEMKQEVQNNNAKKIEKEKEPKRSILNKLVLGLFYITIIVIGYYAYRMYLDTKYEFYIDFFADELSRVKRLGFNKIVLHPGSAVSTSREDGINNIIEALNKVFDKTEGVNVLLETMAGKGNELGVNIDEIKTIIDGIKDKSRIYVCLDTCHLNDSGIDLNKFDEYLNEFDKKIGINKIKCVHVNDSMNPIASHKDRHQNIGYGTIGFDALNKVVHNKRLDGIPFILETPWVHRNEPNEYPPYKYEIENFRNENFVDFIK